MATRPIGAGTCNLAVNMPRDLRADVGRLAAMEDESAGAWIRELIVAQVREAKLSGRLAQAGQLTMRLGAWLVFSVGAAVTGYEAFLGDSQPRRRGKLHEPTRLVRVVRDFKGVSG